MPTFHPVTDFGAEAKEEPGKVNNLHVTKISQPMVNIGVWGWGPPDYKEFVSKNRALEHKLSELGGRKWLYAQTFYTENEFWGQYGRSWYQALREKYQASSLPTVYDKVKYDIKAKLQMQRRWDISWLSTWPIGGLYGMVLATLSGDIGLHRQAKWRYKLDN